MEKIYTHTNATFVTASGETVPYEEIFESIRKSTEVYGTEKGWYMSVKDLEDLLQDSILKAIKYHGSFDSSKSLAKTWAGRIAANAQKDALESYNRRYMLKVEKEDGQDGSSDSGEERKEEYVRRLVPLTKVSDDGTEYIDPKVEMYAGYGYEADRKLESSEALERIGKAIASLPESYQLIISLRMEEEMQPRDIAKVLGCSAQNAATLLCRARKALGKALGRDFLAAYGIAA